MKKGILIGALAFLAGIVVTCGILWARKPYSFSQKQSFSDVSSFEGELSSNGQMNITKLLQSSVVETDDQIGFSSRLVETDLYLLNAYVKYCTTFQDEECLKKLKTIINASYLPSPDNLSILNLLYYVNICESMSVDYSYQRVAERLKDFYDPESNLFFLTDVNSSLNQKITITALCVEQLPLLRTDPMFSLEQGAKQAYTSYDFSTSKEKTFFNSGADILNLYKQLELIDANIIREKTSWFLYWEQEFSSIVIDDIAGALLWAEFGRIAELFVEKDFTAGIQDYYNKLTVEDCEDWKEQVDFLMISNAFAFVDQKANPTVYQYFSQTVSAAAQGQLLTTSEMDIQNTAYGVLLADMVEYPLDHKKLQNFIQASYESIDVKETVTDKINTLYYTTIVDEQNNNYGHSRDVAFYQSVIDDVLQEIDYVKNPHSAVMDTRKAVELIMNLQIHQLDVKLSQSQKNRIEKGMKALLKEKEVVESVCITDLYLLDSALQTQLIPQEDFFVNYQLLEQNGGAKTVVQDDVKPDMYSTFRFFTCFMQMNDYDRLDDQKMFVETLRVEDALYGEALNNGTTLESVYFGNCIVGTTQGGDKE